jgi:hypothetical protein
MKNLVRVAALVFVLGFISCTDNDKLVPENETAELQSTTKDGDVHVGGDDEEEGDNDL